jgi:hypothetical protein
MPSTQIRDARAVRAFTPSTRTDPDADIRGFAGAGFGRVSVTGLPSTRNPAGVSGNSRCPLGGSSTTRPGSAASSGTRRFGPPPRMSP